LNVNFPVESGVCSFKKENYFDTLCNEATELTAFGSPSETTLLLSVVLTCRTSETVCYAASRTP